MPRSAGLIVHSFASTPFRFAAVRGKIAVVTRTRTVLGAMSCLSVLALAACAGEEPQPKLAPSPSPSAAPSPSSSPPEPVEPTMPAAARGTDAAAAEAFVKFYWAVVDYAQTTGHLGGLEEMTDATCRACMAGLRALEETFAKGGEVRGGTKSVSHVKSAFFDGGARITVWCDLSNTRQVVDLPGTSKDEVYPASTTSIQSVLRATDDGWVLEYWGKGS